MAFRSAAMARLTLGVVSVTLSSCALVIDGVRAAADASDFSAEQVEEATAKKDVQTLDEVCRGSREATDREVQEIACDRANLVRLSDHTDCSTLRSGFTDRGSALYRKVLATKYVGCKFYSEVFATCPTHEALMAINSPDLKKGFISYAEANPGEAFFKGCGDMDETEKWLEKTRSTDLCATVRTAIASSDETMMGSGLGYLTYARCAEALPVGLKLLNAREPVNRALACSMLGSVGGPEALRAIDQLAQTDTFFEVRDAPSEDSANTYGVRVYPVREECAEAARAIRFRTSP